MASPGRARTNARPSVGADKLHHCLRNYDVCAFRHELRYGDPNSRNEQGRTCLEQALQMAEHLITRSICTTHVVEKDETSRMDHTIRQLKAMVATMKCLVADERTAKPDCLFLADMPPPYFMLAALKTVAEDYPDERGQPRDSTDNLAMHRVVAEVLAGPSARHSKHVRFLANFPEHIRRIIELIGRERFKPDPTTAQRFMNMAFVFHEPELFKIAAATPRLYSCGDLGNWDEILAVLQTSGSDKLRDFFFAILASKLREEVRVEVTDLAHKKVFNIPQRIHVSQRLLEASRDVFGDQVANCATRLRQRFLRPVKSHVDTMSNHAAVADELAEMSWKDVCTAIRSIG